MSKERPEGLLRWQWELYPRGHRARLTLIVHLLTVPMFILGTLSLLSAPLLAATDGLAAAAGPASGALGMLVAVIAQGRTHKREATQPEPFLGPGDVVARLFVEQWVTFPRFVFSGKFAKAWEEAGR